MYGGAAGGGKSDALLMAALEYVDRPEYSAILFRRTYADLARRGALMDRAKSWLLSRGVKWQEKGRRFTFPSGATLEFGCLEHSDDRFNYQSAEYHFIGFDELTQFAEGDYAYLLSRLRRADGCTIPLRMRSATNPGGRGHDWVKRRFMTDPTLDQAFVPARLQDNPHIDQESYEVSLSHLDPLTRAQLLMGDWDAADDKLLSYESMIAITDDRCLWLAGMMPSQTSWLFGGFDVGRTKHRSCLWTWEGIGDVLWAREVVVLHKTPYDEQEDIIRQRLDTGRYHGFRIDKGGIGSSLAERLERDYPAICEGVQLNKPTQGRLAVKLAERVFRREMRIPDDPEIRDDWRLIRRIGEANGTTVVETDEDDMIGHGDRFWAAALACDCSTEPTPRRFGRPRGYAAQRR